MSSEYSPETRIHGVPLVTEKSYEFLNPRQVEAYRSHREQLIRWMLNLGKDPEQGKGLAEGTVRPRAYRLDDFYRYVWIDLDEGYTTDLTTGHADEYMRDIAVRDYSAVYKAGIQKALKTLFKWQQFQYGKDVDWEPELTFTDSSGSHSQGDYLVLEEREKLRQASLEHGSIPHYDTVTPEQRDRWKAYLAQRFGKPKAEIGIDDWDRANSFKIPSLIHMSLDAGFRPIEVHRAQVSWLDLDSGVFRVPKAESSKNTDYWTGSLRADTVTYLRKWLEERRQYDKYDDSDAIWLTRDSTRYSSQSLNRLLNRLLETAGITRDGITWYSIRRSTCTYMSAKKGLAAVQSQCRMKNVDTAARYDQTPVEDRRDALNEM